jgi:hypothetical protein
MTHVVSSPLILAATEQRGARGRVLNDEDAILASSIAPTQGRHTHKDGGPSILQSC